MKRIFFLLAIAVVLLMGAGLVSAQQQGQGYGPNYGQDYGTPQSQGWFCPWCGSAYGRGPGMMQGRDPRGGYGMGPGMMQGWGGQGYGIPPDMMQNWNDQGAGRGYGMRHRRGGRGYGMGSGMMHGRGGYGRQPGMMDQGWGRGQYGPSGGQQQMEPMRKETARDLAENYAAGNPNLKVGEVSEQEDVFVATIVTRDGSLVEKLEIDKNSGWMRRRY